MAKDYIGSTDAAKLAFGKNFIAVASPLGEAIGLDPIQLAALGGLVDAYETALATATNPATKGAARTLEKNTLRDQMVESLRKAAAIVQAHPGVTDQQRFDLGLTIRREPTPGHAPQTAPDIDVISMSGWRMRARIHDAASGRRGRVPGATGISLFTYVGETPSTNPADWVFYENTTKTVVEVDFPTTLEPGTRVWLTAFWFNAHGSSPASEAAGGRIQYAIGLAA